MKSLILFRASSSYLGLTEMEASKKMRFCMTDLSEEYLYMILEKLDANLDRNSLGLTCHRFLDIQNSSRKCLELGTISLLDNSSCTMNIDSCKLDKLLKRFTQLESLSLSKCTNVSDSGLSRLQNCGSKLHTLYPDDLCKVTNKGLSAIASGCPILSVISLSGCAIGDKGLKILAESCKVLKEVDLACCIKITDSGIRSLIQNCQQLKTLNISRCRKIRGVGFQGFSPTLACLKADYCVFDEGVTGYLSGGGLEYISVASMKSIGGDGRRKGLAAIGLGFAANLKILDFHRCRFAIDYVITFISRGCPLLQEWDLSYCYSVNDFGYEAIGLNCKNLEKIRLNGCFSFGDDSLLALGNGCKRLSVIHMKSCTGITSTGKHVFQTQREDVKIIESETGRIVPRWVFTR